MLGEDVEDLVERHAGLAEDDRQGEDVEVAHAVVVRQPRLRAHAQAARDRLAVADRAERRAAAEVAGDHLEVVAAEQLGHPAGDVAMAGPVEPPAADAELGRPLVGDGVPLVGLGDRPVEAGLERGDQRQLGNRSRSIRIALVYGGLWAGATSAKASIASSTVLVHELDAGEVPRVDRLEADRRDLGGVGEHADLGVGQLVEADLHGVAVVGDRLDQLDARPGAT